MIENSDSSGQFDSDSDTQLLKMEQIATSPEPTLRRSKLIGFKPLINITQTIGGLILLLTCFWTFEYAGGFGWRSNVALQFNWHPFLMILAMVLLYSESIMIYRVGRDIRKLRLKYTHAALHGVILLLVLIAEIAVFDFHNYSVPPKPNLYTLHSWIGLTTVLLFVLQYIIGFVSFLYPGANNDLRAALLPVHAFFGLLTFVFAIAACVVGLNEKAIFKLSDNYGAYAAEGLLINTIGVLLLIYGAFVVYLVTKPEYRRVEKAEDNSLLNN